MSNFSCWILFGSIMIFTVVAACYTLFCPIIKQFPPLTGPYAVGVTTAHVEDSARAETLTEHNEPHERRKLTLHIWHPATEHVNCKKALYLPGKMAFLRQAFAMQYPKLAPFKSCLLPGITTQACRDAKLLRKEISCPVVIFSHGLLGLSSDTYSVILEELASHGFIVVGIDHTYLNFATLIGKGILKNSAALSERFERMPVQEQRMFQSMAIELYKSDVRFVLDLLKQWNDDSTNMWHQAFDLDHVGVMGHSAGGTAALEIGRTDNRIKSCVNLDGWYDHIIANEPMNKPTLLLFGSQSIEMSEPTEAYLKRKD